MTSNIRDLLSDTFDESFKNVENVNDLHDLVVKIMSNVEHYTSLTGKQKKELVMSVILKSINDSPLMKNSPKEVEFLINNSIPSMVNLIINVSKNKNLFSKKTKKKLCFCW
jgi:hypothetical protein